MWIEYNWLLNGIRSNNYTSVYCLLFFPCFSLFTSLKISSASFAPSQSKAIQSLSTSLHNYKTPITANTTNINISSLIANRKTNVRILWIPLLPTKQMRTPPKPTPSLLLLQKKKKWKKWKKKKITLTSETGNRTPVARVTGGSTSHYTISDQWLLGFCDFAFGLFKRASQ